MIFQLTILFSILMFALALSMFIHTYRSRRKILKNFEKFARKFGASQGRAVQKSILSFPTYEGKDGEKSISAFFHIAEGKQTSVIYFTSAIDVKAPFSVFLKKEQFYRPIQNNRLDKSAGILVTDIDPRFEVRSHDEARTRAFFKNDLVLKHIAELEKYPAIQCGPDAIIISKPYDGVKDTLPESIADGFAILKDLSTAMEAVH